VHAGVANIGKRPTVDGVDERLEVHLFDFAQQIYGQHIAVRFRARLRDEMRFDGLDELKAQIARDAAAARAFFATTL
jgi:riboflavin kinase/FMN adenylyltransferase